MLKCYFEGRKRDPLDIQEGKKVADPSPLQWMTELENLPMLLTSPSLSFCLIFPISSGNKLVESGATSFFTFFISLYMNIMITVFCAHIYILVSL